VSFLINTALFKKLCGSPLGWRDTTDEIAATGQAVLPASNTDKTRPD